MKLNKWKPSTDNSGQASTQEIIEEVESEDGNKICIAIKYHIDEENSVRLNSIHELLKPVESISSEVHDLPMPLQKIYENHLKTVNRLPNSIKRNVIINGHYKVRLILPLVSRAIRSTGQNITSRNRKVNFIWGSNYYNS
jgi:hypothetical protein